MKYQYPTDESATDSHEKTQDPHKRLRETAMIQAMIAHPWRTAMDFGCGIGRNFELFHKSGSSEHPAELLAVDIDKERLAAARSEGRKFEGDKFKIFYAPTLSTIDSHLRDNRIDIILACQVFTHMPTSETIETLTYFRKILSPGGVLVICAPFHIAQSDGDFFHKIPIKSINLRAVERIKIDESEFNATSRAHRTDTLPVRAFQSDIITEIASNSTLPCNIGVPKFFKQLEGFAVSCCLAYSIHVFCNNAASIGDLIIKLKKED
jgi:ubiquinone/menaquinone biosynthesis C-methylase UbiE